MLLTGIWVLIGAILIMPHFAEKKMTKKDGKIDKLETNFENRLNHLEDTVTIEFRELPKIPGDIPSMKDIQKIIDTQRELINKNLATVKDNILDNAPQMMLNAIDSPKFEEKIKQYEGRMYAAKGVDIKKLQALTADYTHGMEAAEKVYIDKIQNGDPDDRTEVTLILRDALQLAEDNGYIEEGSTEQKIGLIQGVMRLIDRLSKRGNTSSYPANGGSLLSSAPSNLPSGGGSELDNYYR